MTEASLATARLYWQMGNWEELAALSVEAPEKGATCDKKIELLLYKMQGCFVTGALDEGRDLAGKLSEAGVSRRLIGAGLLSGAQSNLARSWQLLDAPDRAENAIRASVELHPDNGDPDPVVALRIKQLRESTDRKTPCRNVLRYASSDLGPLKKNQVHQFAARHALCHYPSGAVYTFIPKNGCTTLRYSLALSNGFISGASGFEWIHTNNSTFIAGLRELVVAPYRFVVLRCPFARLASLFLDKIVSQKDVMGALSKINTTDKLPSDLTFRDFVRLLRSKDARRENHHWRAQVDFLVYRSYEGWFRLENFAQAATEIERNTGLIVQDARDLSDHSLDRFELVDGMFADSTVNEIKALQGSRRSPSHGALYDPELVDEVGRSYAEDIALYQKRFGPESLRNDSPVLKLKGR